MATIRKLCTAKIEREVSVPIDPDGYSSQLSDEVGCQKMKKIKKDPQPGKIAGGNLNHGPPQRSSRAYWSFPPTLKNKGIIPLIVLMLYFTGVIFPSWCDNV